MRLAGWLGLIMALLLGGAACTSDSRQPGMGATLTIFASTSLTEVFTSMANGFSTANPAVRVNLTFGPDSDLARRSAAGPAPDLIALEGQAPVAAAGPTGTPVLFAHNQLVLAIPADNPKGVRALADLNRSDIRLALCVESEPCGTVATALLTEAQMPVPATAMRVTDVRAAMAQLRDGQVDVALVYRSDARLAGDSVATLEFAQSQAAQADLCAAIPTAAQNPVAARTFLDYLTSPSTLDGLTHAGFGPPT
jgi:molybdate transport system substrate-binding protein